MAEDRPPPPVPAPTEPMLESGVDKALENLAHAMTELEIAVTILAHNEVEYWADVFRGHLTALSHYVDEWQDSIPTFGTVEEDRKAVQESLRQAVVLSWSKDVTMWRKEAMALRLAFVRYCAGSNAAYRQPAPAPSRERRNSEGGAGAGSCE